MALVSWSVPSPWNASLDRIDNAKGYIQGNVRFITVMANLARSTFTDEQVLEFCHAVVQNHKKEPGSEVQKPGSGAVEISALHHPFS